jgi:hypothetical protein
MFFFILMILFFVFSSEMPKHDKVCIIENNMENILYGETNTCLFDQ